MQERPVDIVVDGFIHLQQYHVCEIARGLAGIGTYQLKYDHPISGAVHAVSDLVITPADIVSCLQQPPTDMNKPQQRIDVEDCQSDAAHAQLLSSRVTLCDGVWIVDDNVLAKDKFMVKLSVCLMPQIMFFLLTLIIMQND